MPSAWAGAATVRATLSCPSPVADADAEVLARRIEALGIDGEARVIDAQHAMLTLRGVRGLDVVHSLIAPYRLEMTEAMDDGELLNAAVAPDAVPLGVSVRSVGRDPGALGLFASSPEALAPLGTHAPASSRLAIGCATASGAAPECEGVFVRVPAAITNADVESAEVVVDPERGVPYVAIVFTAAGASRFGLLTRGLVGRRLAIVLDDRLMSAPLVLEEISGGRASLTLGATGALEDVLAEAHALATALDVGTALSCAWALDAVN